MVDVAAAVDDPNRDDPPVAVVPLAAGTAVELPNNEEVPAAGVVVVVDVPNREPVDAAAG